MDRLFCSFEGFTLVYILLRRVIIGSLHRCRLQVCTCYGFLKRKNIIQLCISHV